jgi:hypothetical protein
MALTPSDHVTILFFNCSDISIASVRLPTSLAHFPQAAHRTCKSHPLVLSGEDPKTVPLVLVLSNWKSEACLHHTEYKYVYELRIHDAVAAPTSAGLSDWHGTTLWYDDDVVLAGWRISADCRRILHMQCGIPYDERPSWMHVTGSVACDDDALALTRD